MYKPEIKYITYIDALGNKNGILFPEITTHVRVANKLMIKDNIIGAGFADIGQDAFGEIVIDCHSKSVSLDIASHEEDGHLLSKLFFGNSNI